MMNNLKAIKKPIIGQLVQPNAKELMIAEIINKTEIIKQACALVSKDIDPNLPDVGKGLLIAIKKTVEERDGLARNYDALHELATAENLKKQTVISDMQHLLRMRKAGVLTGLNEIEYLQKMEQVLSGEHIDKVIA